MKLPELFGPLKEYPRLIACITVILTPSIWTLASLHYCERIEAQKEQLKVLQERIQFLETAVRNPPTIRVGEVPASDQKKSLPQQDNVASGEIKVRYPRISDPKQLSKDEVIYIAKFYRLFDHWKVNSHLRFKERDISYWYEQGLSEDKLKRELESRRIILERAEAEGQVIDTPGDLSHKAEMLQAEMEKR